MDIDWVSVDLGQSVSMDLARASQEVTVVSPYLTIPGIHHIQRGVEASVGFTLISRFDMTAFALGTTDIEAMRVIAARTGGAVRLLPRLHAKIYARDWSSWWVGSANATGAGLQIEQHGNLEILGHFEGVSASISSILNAIIRESIPVSMHQLEQLELRVAELELMEFKPEGVLSEGDTIWQELVHTRSTGFMVQELPFTQTPRVFLERVETDGVKGDDSLSHDSALLGVAAGRQAGQRIAIDEVGRSFRDIPIVRSLDEFLAESRSFGEITAWLHDRCEDRPTPYRSEIKELTARVLTWLLSLYPDRYRREKPVHSEVFVRVTDEWETADRERLLTEPGGR